MGSEHWGWSSLCCGYQAHSVSVRPRGGRRVRYDLCMPLTPTGIWTTSICTQRRKSTRKSNCRTRCSRCAAATGCPGVTGHGVGILQLALLPRVLSVVILLLLRSDVSMQSNLTYWGKCSCLSFQSVRIQTCITPPFFFSYMYLIYIWVHESQCRAERMVGAGSLPPRVSWDVVGSMIEILWGWGPVSLEWPLFN